MVQALGSLQSVMKAKYSSPIFFTSKSLAPVPTSSSRSSSVRLTMRAPQALAHQNVTLDTHKSELRKSEIRTIPCQAQQEQAPDRSQYLPGNPVVVSLSHPADGGDVGSHQVVLGQVWNQVCAISVMNQQYHVKLYLFIIYQSSSFSSSLWSKRGLQKKST